MNRKSQQTMQGMNRNSRLLPHLGAASDLALPCMELPLLDGRNLRALTAHCVNLAGLINFFESSQSPFGTWGDILLLRPELVAACIIEEVLQEEQNFEVDRPTRISSLVEDTVLPNLEEAHLEQTYLIDTLIQEEVEWQNVWIERFEKTGASLSVPPFPSWPREGTVQQGKEPSIKNTEIDLEIEHNHMANKAYWRDTTLRLALRRSFLLESAGSLWETAISCPEGNLSPHVGMLFAFLERYSRLQQSLNTLVPLYASHFYEKVMGFSPRPAVPDRVLACFTSTPDMPWSTVPRGSLLTMPSPALSFVTESAVPFSQTVLEQLRAIIPMQSPEAFGSSGPSRPSGPFGPFALCNVKTKEQENRLWAPFKNRAKDFVKNSTPSDSLGVGSSVFTLAGMELCGGLRKLIFTFELESENNDAISNISTLKEAWENRPLDFASVSISGEDGWLSPVNLDFHLAFDSDVLKDEQKNEEQNKQAKTKLSFCENTDSENLTNSKENATSAKEYSEYLENSANPLKVTATPKLIVSLSLEAHQSGIVAPQKDSHGIAAAHPVMRFTPSIVESTLWQAFNAFKIKNMSLDIRVQNLQECELIIEGNSIQNPKEGTVEIFGAVPKKNSSFVLSVPELAHKHIDSLHLSWQWEAPERFDHYFMAYSFKPIFLTPAIRKEDGTWHAIDMPVCIAGKSPEKLLCPVPESGKITSWRWALSHEGSLFGQEQYPHLLAMASLNESSFFRKIWANITNSPRLKDVNPPFAPAWSAIAVDYTAKLNWDIEASQVVAHEHPWAGIYPAYPDVPKLFPHYDRYSLSMSFSTGTETEEGIPLSLYCRLQNVSADGKGPEMSIHGADMWKDETKGFSASGIIGMTPHTTNMDITIPKSFHVRFDWADEPLIALQNVHEHAIWAMYAPADEAELNTRSFPLPVNSLETVAEVITPKSHKKTETYNLKDLKVGQPYASIGGRSQGGLSLEEYRQDCAEELLHRGQAILPRDFERLLLREFPDVLLSLCVPHSSENLAGSSPGSVSLVVFSPPDGAKIHELTEKEDGFRLDPYLPAYADAELMRQMTKYIDNRSSPYANITLIHPVYQKIDAEICIQCDEMKNPMEAEREIRNFLEENIAPWAFEPSTTVFDQMLDISALRGKLEAFAWILNVSTFSLSIQSEIVDESLISSTNEITNKIASELVDTSASEANESARKNGIILAGIGGLFYPNELQITCIRAKEGQHA